MKITLVTTAFLIALGISFAEAQDAAQAPRPSVRSVASVLQDRGDDFVDQHQYLRAAEDYKNASAIKSVEPALRETLKAKASLMTGMAAAQKEMKKFTTATSPQQQIEWSKEMIAPIDVCRKVFEPGLAERAAKEYAKERLDIFGGAPMAIQIEPGDLELHVTAALSEDLNERKKTARNFAGGWKRVAGKMKPGFVFYRISFVEPGQTSGMSYDGFVQVDGMWYAFPKVWRLSESASQGEDAPGRDAEAR